MVPPARYPDLEKSQLKRTNRSAPVTNSSVSAGYSASGILANLIGARVRCKSRYMLIFGTNFLGQAAVYKGREISGSGIQGA